MAPLDTEAQFKFLIACIKFTKDGKVSAEEFIVPSQTLTIFQPDFGQVAAECGIVTKGAA